MGEKGGVEFKDFIDKSSLCYDRLSISLTIRQVDREWFWTEEYNKISQLENTNPRFWSVSFLCYSYAYAPY